MEKKCVSKDIYKSEKGITLVALVVTIIVYRVFYDKNIKYSNLVELAYDLYKLIIELLLKKIIILFFWNFLEKFSKNIWLLCVLYDKM